MTVASVYVREQHQPLCRACPHARTCPHQLRARPHEHQSQRLACTAPLPSPSPAQVDIACLDLSFISVLKVAGPVARVLAGAGSQMVVLIKPQFEAGRQHVCSGGVVRDPKVGGEGPGPSGWGAGGGSLERSAWRPAAAARV